jgi:putative chitinase
MITITPEILKAIAPRNKKPQLIVDIVPQMNKWFPLFEIDTKGEICHYLAQYAHETDSFNSLEEYATGKAYEKRWDLGNKWPGDGPKFKGRGGFMTTGRTNYSRLTLLSAKAFGKEIDFVQRPDLLVDSQYAVWSACIYWNDKHFNDIANMPDSKIIQTKIKGKLKPLSPVEYISYRINGGFNGINDRIRFYERAKKVIK